MPEDEAVELSEADVFEFFSISWFNCDENNDFELELAAKRLFKRSTFDCLPELELMSKLLRCFGMGLLGTCCCLDES